MANGAAAVTVPASAFGIGTHTMTAAYSGTHAFAPVPRRTSFTVADLQGPVIAGLADLTVEATSPSGSVVTFAPTATDDVDGPVPVTCVPVSGTRSASA